MPIASSRRSGKFWTSAGITAGIDLSLALIAEDLGEAVARKVAQQLVVYYRRPGGQSQFSTLLELERADGRFAPLLDYVRSNLRERLSVEELAAQGVHEPAQFRAGISGRDGHESGACRHAPARRNRAGADRERRHVGAGDRAQLRLRRSGAHAARVRQPVRPAAVSARVPGESGFATERIEADPHFPARTVYAALAASCRSTYCRMPPWR